MERFYSILFRSATVLLTVAAAWSCMEEDRSDCPEGQTRVIVKFDPAMYELPAGEHRIENVYVYIFDETQRFVGSFAGGEYDYLSEQDFYINADLEEGVYRFIAWTNLGDTFKSNNAPSAAHMEVYLEGNEGNVYTEDIPDIHYGSLADATVDNRQIEEHDIYLIPNTYRINLAVKGLAENADTYQFVVTDNNSRFNLDNSIVPGTDDFHYMRTSRFEEGEIKASMRTLPLTDSHTLPTRTEREDRATAFSFSNSTTGEVLYSDNLVKMIRKAYEKAGLDIDFNRIYKFDITLTFDSKMNVTISVNGWKYTPNETEL